MAQRPGPRAATKTKRASKPKAASKAKAASKSKAADATPKAAAGKGPRAATASAKPAGAPPKRPAKTASKSAKPKTKPKQSKPKQSKPTPTKLAKSAAPSPTKRPTTTSVNGKAADAAAIAKARARATPTKAAKPAPMKKAARKPAKRANAASKPPRRKTPPGGTPRDKSPRKKARQAPAYLAAELGQPVDHEGEPIGAGSPRVQGDADLQEYALQLWRQMQSGGVVKRYLRAIERAGLTVDEVWTAGLGEARSTSSTPDEMRRYKQRLLFRANLLEALLTETIADLHRLEGIEPTPAPIPASTLAPEATSPPLGSA